jgi:hypothetical protein
VAIHSEVALCEDGAADGEHGNRHDTLKFAQNNEMTSWRAVCIRPEWMFCARASLNAH